MYLVYEKKNFPGKWAVSWMWLPHFLAADRDLHRHVDRTMTEEFRGTMIDGNASGDPRQNPQLQALVEKLNTRVMDLILEKYPIAGLRQMLDSYGRVEPEGNFDELQ